MNRIIIICLVIILEIVQQSESGFNRNFRRFNSKREMKQQSPENENQRVIKQFIDYLLRYKNTASDDKTSYSDDKDDATKSEDDVNDSTSSEQPMPNIKLYIIDVQNKPKFDFVAKRAFSQEHLPNKLKVTTEHHFTQFPRKDEIYSNELYVKDNNQQPWKDIKLLYETKKPWKQMKDRNNQYQQSFKESKHTNNEWKEDRPNVGRQGHWNNNKRENEYKKTWTKSLRPNKESDEKIPKSEYLKPLREITQQPSRSKQQHDQYKNQNKKQRNKSIIANIEEIKQWAEVKKPINDHKKPWANKKPNNDQEKPWHELKTSNNDYEKRWYEREKSNNDEIIKTINDHNKPWAGKKPNSDREKQRNELKISNNDHEKRWDETDTSNNDYQKHQNKPKKSSNDNITPSKDKLRIPKDEYKMDEIQNPNYDHKEPWTEINKPNYDYKKPWDEVQKPDQGNNKPWKQMKLPLHEIKEPDKEPPLHETEEPDYDIKNVLDDIVTPGSEVIESQIEFKEPVKKPQLEVKEPVIEPQIEFKKPATELQIEFKEPVIEPQIEPKTESSEEETENVEDKNQEYNKDTKTIEENNKDDVAIALEATTENSLVDPTEPLITDDDVTAVTQMTNFDVSPTGLYPGMDFGVSVVPGANPDQFILNLGPSAVPGFRGGVDTVTDVPQTSNEKDSSVDQESENES